MHFSISLTRMDGGANPFLLKGVGCSFCFKKPGGKSIT